MNRRPPGLPVHQQLLEFTQTHMHQVGDAIQPSLCHPLCLLPSIPPSIRVFSNESTLGMMWPNYWGFSFSIILSKEHPGLFWSYFSTDLQQYIGHLPTWGVPLSVSYHFAFSYCSWGIFWGSRITADGDCSHEIKRRLLLGRKFMTNLDTQTAYSKAETLLC